MSNTTQSKVYECSASNASVRISNSEWINEFSDGIELDVGDTVRVLGSFIQEKGGGDTIEISEDIDLNIGFTPYITAETLKFHISQGADDTQLNLGMFADPAYATDNFGVEPPLMGQFVTNLPGTIKPSTLTEAIQWSQKPILGACVGSTANGDLSDAGMNGQGDSAVVVGWEEDVTSNSSFSSDQNGVGTMNHGFNNFSIPREFHIASLCKRLVVPKFHSIRFQGWSNSPPTAAGTPTNHINNFTFDPARNGQLEWQSGDFIGTYYISGHFNGYNGGQHISEPTTNANFGVPRWAAGPRSVVGKILSIRQRLEPFRQQQNSYNFNGDPVLPLGDQEMEVYEMYVWDFVNPASYKSQNDNKAIPRHGAGEFKNNYSNYPQNNTLNGFTYMCPWNKSGEQIGQEAFMGNIQPGFDDYQSSTAAAPNKGRMTDATNKQKGIGYSANSGLSFFWANKGHCANPNKYNGTSPYNAGETQDICGSWCLVVNDPLQAHWLCQPFRNQANSISLGVLDQRLQQPIDIGEWTEIGALVRIEDINNDNTRSSWLGANDIPFLGVPFTKQEQLSFYSTAYQNNRLDTFEAIFGTKCGTKNAGGFGQYLAPLNLKEPFQSGLSFTNQIPDAGWGKNMPNTTPQAGTFPKGQTVSSTPKGGWNLANYGNDAVCSIHLQNKSGDMMFRQEPTANKVYNEDLLIMKKYKFEIKLKKGYYSVTEMADIINDQLHYAQKDYAQKVGKFTTVGIRERQLASNPSVINGNTIHTYLPDLTYGFYPITQEMADKDANIAAQGVNFDPLTELLTETVEGDGGTNVLEGITDIVVGNLPYTHDLAGNNIRPGGNCLFRLVGGKVDASDDTTNNDQYDYGQKIRRIWPECKNDYYNPNAPGMTSYMLQAYPSRWYYNNLSYGGGATVWVGCPNPTFSWDDALQKFYFEFLYTPIRPVQAEKSGAPELSAGEANPSVLINVDGTGTIGEELGGIYITQLADTKITKSEILQPDILDYPNDTYFQALSTATADNTTFQSIGQNFWDELGFQINGIQAKLNAMSFTPTNFNVYIFEDQNNIYGDAIRNYPEVDVAVNGSNPYKSRCTTIAPYNQFFVSVDSDEFLGDITPRLSNNPFYLIGSDLPTKHYHGGKGTKLPIIGICGRNYARFSYVFDLSESSIMYTVNEKTTVQSIRTHIYLNNMKDADNLQPNSSVVYIVQKGNYAPQMDSKQLQEAFLKYVKQNSPVKVPQEYYYYQNQLDYQLPNPYQESTETDEDE